MKTRESGVIVAARAELAGIVAELRGARRRALAIAKRLERAAKTAENVAVATDGERYTAEGRFAVMIAGQVEDLLLEAIKALAREVRVNHRKDVLAYAQRRDALLARWAAEGRSERE